MNRISIVLNTFIRISWLALFFYSTPLCAGVYRCEKPGGGIEFRDRPCQTDLYKQDFLPISYSNTDPEVIKQQEKELAADYKQILHQETKEDKTKIRTEKQRIKEQEKAERLKLRCQRLNEKIHHLEEQLHRGAKAKRFRRIQEELLHCQTMKRRYCHAISR